MAQGQPKTFEVGLAMAGAVSAGAYSGGVVDFLVQALDEWERAKSEGRTDIPNHQVVIKVISGASAGAITGAIGAVALAGGLQPQSFSEQHKQGQKYRCVLPKLYETWVVKPRLVAAKPGDTDLLSLEDVKPVTGNPSVRSVLNSILLDQIRAGALAVPATRGTPAPYLAKELHVYLTVTNLRGIPYSVEFQGGAYGMQSHGDRMHYIVTGLGTSSTVSPWAIKDAGRQIDVSGLFGLAAPSQDWQNFSVAAIASGAFPIGLAPRQIDARSDEYDARYLPVDLRRLVPFRPAFPWGNATNDFRFLSVDGGLINNEPFEYARYTLMKNPPEQNDRQGDSADRAVIMIDPFPEPPSFAGDGKPASDLLSIAMALLPTLINQARFKPSELVDALDPEVFSRFLIAPHRQLTGKPQELHAIACGLLGGFGGFLDEEFRAHDYQLGRRNCQRFLKDVFALLSDNPIIKEWPSTAQQNAQFQTETHYKGRPRFCIIPLLGSALDEVVLPPWPRISESDLNLLQERIKSRLEAVAPLLVERQTASRLLRLAFKIAVAVSEKRFLELVRYAILSDLVRRDQVAGWELPEQTRGHDPRHIRQVLAELAHPSYDFRTPTGIARATGLDPGDVGAILSFLGGQAGKPYQVWRSSGPGDTPIYTLHSRKPSAFWRFPLISAIGDFLAAPIID